MQALSKSGWSLWSLTLAAWLEGAELHATVWWFRASVKLHLHVISVSSILTTLLAMHIDTLWHQKYTVMQENGASPGTVQAPIALLAPQSIERSLNRARQVLELSNCRAWTEHHSGPRQSTTGGHDRASAERGQRNCRA